MSNDKLSTRRKFLKQMALASVTAPLALGVAAAQDGHMGHGDTGHGGDAGMGHGAGHDMGHGMGHDMMSMPSSALPDIGPDILPPVPIPWEHGVCAFCGMTVVTPEGGANPPGFREKTYAQIRLAPGHELHGEHTLHYESLACMFNHAYTQNIVDGHAATFYVADVMAAPATADDLLLSRSAVFLWAENLSVSMAAHLGAFPSREVLEVYLADGSLGRHHVHTSATLADLAPLPEAGLLGLLIRHSD